MTIKITHPYMLLGLLWAIVFGLMAPLKAGQTFDAYAYALTQAEMQYQIPRGLLTAIAKMESGRYDKQSRSLKPTPWTICVEGKGHFFASKQQALAAVRSYQQKGVKNIDVGIMQINLMHHGHKMPSLEHTFDPKQNIRYAAEFLRSLKEAHGSWSKAVAFYHSASPTFHVPYRARVYDLWKEVKKEQGPLVQQAAVRNPSPLAPQVFSNRMHTIRQQMRMRETSPAPRMHLAGRTTTIDLRGKRMAS